MLFYCSFATAEHARTSTRGTILDDLRGKRALSDWREVDMVVFIQRIGGPLRSLSHASRNTRTQLPRTHDSYTTCGDIRGVYWKTGGELGRIENAANTGDD